MPYYRLYCVSSRGSFFRCHDYDAADDVEAIAKARELELEMAAELWTGTRLVKLFASSKAPA